MIPISAATSVPAISNLPGVTGGTSAARPAGLPGGFSEVVEQFVGQVNESQLTSDKLVDNLVKGETDNVQQVVLAVANAEMSFQLFMEMRNKLIDSYNELMRMQF